MTEVVRSSPRSKDEGFHEFLFSEKWVLNNLFGRSRWWVRYWLPEDGTILPSGEVWIRPPYVLGKRVYDLDSIEMLARLAMSRGRITVDRYLGICKVTGDMARLRTLGI